MALAKKSNTITFDYEPRKQFVPFHKRKERWACMVCHRRAGKTVAAVHELALRALYTKKKNSRYAYIAPFYRQAKDVAWVYLKESVSGIATRIRESELRVELPNGAWITLYGADNPDALRGIYLDGAVLDEFGDARPSLWSQVVLPCLSDRKGWALFIGTPKGKNHFHQIYERSKNEKGWFSLRLKASESGILDNEELLEMKLQMSDEVYEQEMECSFSAAIMGTYYAAMIAQLELQGRIKPGVIKFDASLPVHVAADLGRTDSSAFWFWQETPSGIFIIDYEEDQGKTLDFYIDMLNGKPYNYETVWLPHDAKAKTLATKKSTVEQMLDAKFPCRVVPCLDVQDGINAVRKVLPTCYIDQDACFGGVEALRAYKRKYDELNKCYSNTPLHDWASDGADGFRYLSLVCREQVQLAAPEPMPRVIEKHKYPYSLNDLFKDREAKKTRNVLRL